MGLCYLRGLCLGLRAGLWCWEHSGQSSCVGAESEAPFPWLKLCCLLSPPKGGYGYRRSGRDKYGPPTRTEYRLIVENLSSRCSWQDLKVWGPFPYPLSGTKGKRHLQQGKVCSSAFLQLLSSSTGCRFCTLIQEYICVYETIHERLGFALPELVALDSGRIILSLAPANITYRCVLSSLKPCQNWLKSRQG